MGPYVPPGQLPPFQVVDDLHHGAWIIITAALGLVVSLVSLLIRVYVRLVLSPAFAFDDYLLLGATAVAIVQSSLMFDAASRGFGTSIDLLESDLINQIQTLITTSDVLYLITIYISKCCVVGIYFRLTPQKLHNRVSWATLALCTAWIIAAALVITINCELNRPWKTAGGQCRHLLERWEFITAVDVFTELILFGLAVALLQGLFMPLRRKLTIGFAFFFRLPLIIFAIFHIYVLRMHYLSPDPTLAVVSSKIWSQVELNYSLIACSVFCLHPFMTAVSTNYGTAGDSNLTSSNASRTPKNNSSASKSHSGSGSESALTSRPGLTLIEERRTWRSLWLESRTQKDGVQEDSEKGYLAAGGVVPDGTGSQPIELLERAGTSSAGSGGKKKMIIRKDVQYTVEYNRKKSDAGLDNETEYWDRYLSKDS